MKKPLSWLLEEEVLSITIPWKELAVYEEQSHMGAGKREYALRVGNSSRNTVCGNLCKQNRIMFWSNVENSMLHPVTVESLNFNKG